MKTRKVTYPVSGTSHAFFESVFRFCLPKEYVMLGVLIYLSIAHFKSGLDGLERNTAKTETDLENNFHKFKVVICAP